MLLPNRQKAYFILNIGGSSGLVQILQKSVSRGGPPVGLPGSSSPSRRVFLFRTRPVGTEKDISKGFSGLVQSSRRVVVTCTRVTVAQGLADAALVATLPKGNDPM